MTVPRVTTRDGAAADLAAALALHEQCSATSLRRRFHTPLPRVPARMVRGLLCPPQGWSRLALDGPTVVGMACAAPLSPDAVEVGVLVADREQGRGIGTLLLRETAGQAAVRGYRAARCLTERDNEAVLRTARRTGLPTTVGWDDGLVVVELLLAPAGLPQPA